MVKYVFPSASNAGLTLILGLGETGLAAAKWCAYHGVQLRLLDTRAGLRSKEDIQNIATVIDMQFGPEVLTNFANLDGVKTIVLSPGLNPNKPDLADFLLEAKRRNINIIGEIELFAQALNDLRQQGYRPLLFTVTGTNGKTTVCSLLGHLLADYGLNVRVAGNISPAALDSLLVAVQSDDLPAVWVLELSSFQLHVTSSLNADVAVVLNISQDHLDWHGSMANYARDKAKILQMSRLAIINRADITVRSMVNDVSDKDVRSFGLDAPEFLGDFGLHQQSGTDWLALANGGKSEIDRADARPVAKTQDLMPAAALQIIGQHNVLNVLAALCMVHAAGLPLADLLQCLRTYRGEAHRTEFVRNIAGIDFIDDSKGTNVGATIAALEGIQQPIILIAGGLGKGQDFTGLAQAIDQYAKAVLLIGQDAAQIAKALSDIKSQVPADYANSLEEAVSKAFALAKSGDAVLLSPACASMDMFKNYIHRSQCFINAVQEIALDHGELA